MRRVASTPSQPGMRKSMSTTSGRSRATSATASSPSAAVPTTVRPGSRSRQRRETLSHGGLVVGDRDPQWLRAGAAHAGSRASTCQPPSTGPALRCAPISAARSRMPAMP